MHEAGAVGVGQPPADVQADEEGLRGREHPAVLQHAAQAAAGQVLGHEVWDAVLAPVVHHHHVRVADGGDGTGFGGETTQEPLVVGEHRLEHLDRHLALETDVVGEEDLGRGTRSQGREEAVATADHAADLVGEPYRGHRGNDRTPPGPAGGGRPGGARGGSRRAGCETGETAGARSRTSPPPRSPMSTTTSSFSYPTRTKVIVAVGLALAIGGFVVGGLRADTDNSDAVAVSGAPGQGVSDTEGVVAVSPGDGTQALSQQAFSIRLAPGWTGELTFLPGDGAATPIPADEVEVTALNELVYQPGPDKTIERLPAGTRSCVTADVWDRVRGRDASETVKTWCFDVT